MSEKQQKAYDRFTPAQLTAQYNLCNNGVSARWTRLTKVGYGKLWEHNSLLIRFYRIQTIPHT